MKKLMNTESKVWFVIDVLMYVGWTAFWVIIAYECILEGWRLSAPEDVFDVLTYVVCGGSWLVSGIRMFLHIEKIERYLANVISGIRTRKITEGE